LRSFFRGPARTKRIVWTWLTILALAGLLVSVLQARGATDTARNNAITRAEGIAGTIIAREVDKAFIQDPPDASSGEYRKLASVVTLKVLTDGTTLGLAVWDDEGTIVFSTNPALVGDVFDGQVTLLGQVAAGQVQTQLQLPSKATSTGANVDAAQLLKTFVPLRPKPGASIIGIVEVDEDYAPIKDASTKPWLFLQMGFGSTLLLCLMLLPVMWAGTWLGERIGKRVSQETFSQVMAVLLALTGASLLLK